MLTRVEDIVRSVDAAIEPYYAIQTEVYELTGRLAFLNLEERIFDSLWEDVWPEECKWGIQ
jgi:hypothetical protein